jgi:hypothetical protein
MIFNTELAVNGRRPQIAIHEAHGALDAGRQQFGDMSTDPAAPIRWLDGGEGDYPRCLGRVDEKDALDELRELFLAPIGGLNRGLFENRAFCDAD